MTWFNLFSCLILCGVTSPSSIRPFIFPACWGRCRRHPELSEPSARATQPHKPASSPKARSWAGDGGREGLARPCVSGGGGGASRRRASAAASPHVHTGNSPPARRGAISTCIDTHCCWGTGPVCTAHWERNTKSSCLVPPGPVCLSS